MKTLAAAGSLAALPGWCAHSAEFASPNFTRENILREVAGLRPLRLSGVRLEAEQVGRKLLVHNYGHGGSGYTLAWGTAQEVAEMLPKSVLEVAIIGGGVIGLTTARVLRELGHKVNVYAARMSPDTTSDLAGAQWSPSFCPSGKTPRERARFNRMLARSFRRWADFAGPRFGVFLRPNYIPDGAHDGLQDVEGGILAPFERVQIPFGRVQRTGVKVPSWLIEPPTFLPELQQDLARQGVKFIRREFCSAAEMMALEGDVIVNCCGLGSGKLFADRDLIAMKGQLIWLKNPLGLNYVALYDGYTFCRSDAIVIGGSYQRGVYDTRVDPKISAHILKLNKAFYA